jgi:RNA 2',3'-cyclic 3'-phosphodiesterase
MFRLFVALDLPEEIRDELHAMAFGLPGARWVEKAQIHLTLRFIGEVDGAAFQDIKDALAGIHARPFSMRLKGVGHFPPRKEPRVLWVGVEDNSNLLQLRNRVERALVGAGLEPEHRKFAPHITLARLKDTPLGKLTNFLAGNALYASKSFEVSEFHLYLSRLTAKEAIHTREVTYLLEE